MTCTHLSRIQPVEPSGGGCKECLEQGYGWVELRLCLTCGHVGCCNSSPHRHAQRHFESTGHPIVRSFQREPDWAWCYPDASYVDVEFVEQAMQAALRYASRLRLLPTEHRPFGRW